MIKQIITFNFIIQCYLCLNNGIGLTPPMGWTSQQRFDCNTNCDNFPYSCINERLFIEMIDRIVDDGWLKSGYDTVHIGDCWQKQQREQGEIVADPDRFPKGIKSIADYAHSKGVKLGLFTDIGVETCYGYPGIQDNMKKDVEKFISYGIDHLTVDGCHADPLTMNQTYEEFYLFFDIQFLILKVNSSYPYLSIILNQTALTPIFYSCGWPSYLLPDMIPYKQLQTFCNSWRNNISLIDSQQIYSEIVKNSAQLFNSSLVLAAGPGGWNDPGSLMLGNFAFSLNQKRSQMVLWSMFAAPLIMSNDLRRIDYASKQILQNKEIIAINQDPLGAQAYVLNQTAHYQYIWAKQLSGASDNNTFAIAFQCLLTESIGLMVTFNTSQLPSMNGKVYSFEAKDLFTGEDLGVRQNITRLVEPWNSEMFKIVVIRDQNEDLLKNLQDISQ